MSSRWNLGSIVAMERSPSTMNGRMGTESQRQQLLLVTRQLVDESGDRIEVAAERLATVELGPTNNRLEVPKRA